MLILRGGGIQYTTPQTNDRKSTSICHNDVIVICPNVTQTYNTRY